MNDTERELWTAVKGLGVLGLLRLLWATLSKFVPWMVGRVKGQQAQALDVRRVDIEEGKATQAASDAESERILKQQGQLDTAMMGFLETLRVRVDEQDKKILSLETRVSTEEENRRMAALSAEAAHIRADEADVRRLRAMTEIADLRKENSSLREVLKEAKDSREKDRLMIQSLNVRIEKNLEHIESLETKLSQFTHSTFEMTLAEKGTNDV